MTYDEAQTTLNDADGHTGSGRRRFRIVPYDCPGGFAVIHPATNLTAIDTTDLWYIFTEYDVNIFEELQGIFTVPEIVRLHIEDQP